MKPILKWAGGKTALLPELRKHIPMAGFGRYFEPFAGGAALFWDLLPNVATLGDANQRLIRCYRGVRDDPEAVIRILKERKNTREHFNLVRSFKIDDMPDIDVAAWMIYLNRTCFNGLYRVNKQGIFNVPFAGYKNPRIGKNTDEDAIYAASEALQAVILKYGDFENVIGLGPGVPTKGDLVYFDPPFAPLTATSNFVSYTETGFGAHDQLRLRDCALGLKQRGVHVILSNSDSPLIHQLYGKDFTIHIVNAPRRINSKGDGRGPVKELIIT